jgi:hypothetical protein
MQDEAAGLIARRGGGPGTRRDSEPGCVGSGRVCARFVALVYPYPKAELTEWNGDRGDGGSWGDFELMVFVPAEMEGQHLASERCCCISPCVVHGYREPVFVLTSISTPAT